MWKSETTIETAASELQIWKTWIDVENWHTWDTDVKSAKLNGEFANGTKGILIPSNGPKAIFYIHSAVHLKQFTSRSHLPLAKMDIKHKMFRNNEKLQLTHSIEIKGITSFIFAKLIGEKIAKNFAKTMVNLSQIAQNTK